MKRLLFVRNFKRPTGGNVAVRDYFFHALAYPRLDTRLYFAPGSRHAESDLWNDLPADRLVTTPDWHSFDFVFVNGKDWRLIPDGANSFRIIHLVQHLGYADDPELRGYLRRPALRICLSRAAQETIAPHAVGATCVIPSGVDPKLFFEDESRRPGSVLVWGGKAPDVAQAIGEQLAALGVEVSVIDGWLPRAAFAARLRTADVFVALPMAREGFYRPPLEAMACGCAVVCSDALGNRAHCLSGVTCLQPRHGDADDHVAAVLRLLADSDLRERLRREGRTHARRFDLTFERASLHAVFDRLLDEA
jgi:glycosyltransferase involved in cell wall biosynthesis